jgi:hypothetical protein
MPFSNAQMVYAEVVLGKRVDWTTINIQTNSNMIAPLQAFFGLGRKLPHGGLGKKMPSKDDPNLSELWSETSIGNKKISCIHLEKRLLEATIKGRMVENALINMVDNDNTEGALFLPAIEGIHYQHDGEDSGSTTDEGMPDMEAHINPFEMIKELEQ